MSQAVIECQNVSKHYRQGNETLHVLKDISFVVEQGDSVAIVGASGAGKSTLLNLLGGLDFCDAGSVSVLNKDLAKISKDKLAELRNREVGFVYQFHHLLTEFSALENAAMPLLIRGEKRKAAYSTARQILERVGLGARANHRPSELSGGERQRVAIARALVGTPSCVLMDEPTGNLDEATADTIQQLLISLNQDLGTSFIVVTHDKTIARQQKRILQLHEGQLQEITPDRSAGVAS
ncbi:Lipoprotein-releasing system ATP-binding protein LolD [BD1-7 clade bacterium]|uniref:Lipoprotein-releasing system ATP-binding protein LolD n=1 Tax=BD1-7 clade bacterium TaxID=2029982 RepID=A0A5S9NUD1_9GAMM|nr:Lipoprotein-releasing system ATP-binding protein LolD [BD1-7 clade bacterium]CAA0094231.1 Lipoprotein-releasing system ATP-binding protein LolD [BD1-7 clade bacterium]